MISFLNNAIRIGMIFLFGCTGEIITEKSGHLNLGIPGVMFVGTAAGCVTASWIVNACGGTAAMNGFQVFLCVLLPLLATLLGGALMGLLFSFFTVTLRANQNVTGLVLNILGEGLCYFMMDSVSRSTYSFSQASRFFRTPLPFVTAVVEKGGFFGGLFELLFSYGFLVYLAIGIAVAASLVLARTRVGLHLRAVGENPATADAAGINVSAYRYGATCVGCAIAALGGFFAVMDYLCGSWSYSIDAFGWLSIALVIFAMWKPWLGIIGSVVFGALYTLSSVLNVSIIIQPLFEMIPYVATILVLVIISVLRGRENQPPAGLGLPYFREDR